MKYGLLVIGPAGSGKSTFCHALQQHMEIVHRRCRVVNLDPAAEVFLYKPFIDVRELITVEEAAAELGLGPNGALVYAMEFLQEHVTWLEEQLHECGEDEFFVFDCAGQIELYTHLPLMKNICISLQQAGLRLAACCCLDISFMNDAAKLFGGSLMALSSMIQLELPHINLLTKCDLVSRHVSSSAEEGGFSRKATSASSRVKKHKPEKTEKIKIHSQTHSHKNALGKHLNASHATAEDSNSTTDNGSSTRSRGTGEQRDYAREEEERKDEEERSSSGRYSFSSSSNTEKEVCRRKGRSSSKTDSADEEDYEEVDDEEAEGREGDAKPGKEGSRTFGLSRGIGFGVLSGHALREFEREEKDLEGEEMTKEKAIDALLSRDPQHLLQQLDACTPAAYQSLNASFAALLEDYNLVSFLPCDITEEDSLSAVALVLEQTLQFGEDLEVRETDIFGPSE